MMKYLLTALMLSLAAPAAALTSFEPDPAGVCSFAGVGTIEEMSLCFGPQEGPIFQEDLTGLLGVANWYEIDLVEDIVPETKAGTFVFDFDAPMAVSVKTANQTIGGVLEEGAFTYDLERAVSHYRLFSTVAPVPLPAPLLMFGSLLLATGLWYRFAIK